MDIQVIRLEQDLQIDVPEALSFVEHEIEFMKTNMHLPLLPLVTDGQRLKFHTGGLQTLEELLRNIILSAEVFKKLLHNIAYAVTNISTYILDEKRLLLAPNLICVDHQYNVFLSYLPVEVDPGDNYSLKRLFKSLVDMQELVSPHVKYQELKQAISHPYFSSQLVANVLNDIEEVALPEKKGNMLTLIVGAVGVLTITFALLYFKYLKYIWISGLLTVGIIAYYFVTNYQEKKCLSGEGTTLIQLHQMTKLTHLVTQCELVIDDDLLAVGRSRKKKHPLNHKSISKRHATIERKDQGYFLEDLGSTNGTFLNGEKIHSQLKYRISNGDQIAFAKEIFKFTST